MSGPNNADVRRRFIVATGGADMRNGSKSNGSNLGGTYRGQVELKATCRDLSMIFVNAYANSGLNGDNQMLIRASITSQADGVTAIPLYFNGQRTAIMDPGGSIESDPLPVTFQKGVILYQVFVQALGTYEVDTLGLGAASAGSVVDARTWGGVTYTSAAINWNDTNATVQGKLLAATGPAGQLLPAGGLVVSGGPLPAAVTITYQGQMTGAITAQSATPTGLTGGTVTYTRVTNGVYPGTYVNCPGYESQTAGAKAMNAGNPPSSQNNYAAAPGGVDLTTGSANTGLAAAAVSNCQAVAIIGAGPSLVPSVVTIGDSIAQGFGDVTSQGASRWAAGFIMRALNNGFPYVRCESFGDVASNFALQSRIAGRAHVLKYAHYAICEYGSNDVYGLVALATIQASLIAIWDMCARRGVKVFQTTICPRTTSTDLWVTTGNQSLVNGNATRLTLNAWIRQGAPVMPGSPPTATTNGTTGAVYAGQTGHPLAAHALLPFGCIEVADVCETARDSGIWIVTGGANYACADGIHPSTALNILMAAAIPLGVFV